MNFIEITAITQIKYNVNYKDMQSKIKTIKIKNNYMKIYK